MELSSPMERLFLSGGLHPSPVPQLGWGHCWKCLLEWLKDSLGICDCGVAVTCFGLAPLAPPGIPGLPGLSCSSTEPPGHPALPLGPREDCGGPSEPALSIPCSPWHICPHRAVWGCSGSPSALRAPGNPKEDLWGWQWAVLYGMGCLALPDSSSALLAAPRTHYLADSGECLT